MSQLSDVLKINSENEIVAKAIMANIPKMVIPYDWYTELANQLGYLPSETEQLDHFGVNGCGCEMDGEKARVCEYHRAANE